MFWCSSVEFGIGECVCVCLYENDSVMHVAALCCWCARVDVGVSGLAVADAFATKVEDMKMCVNGMAHWWPLTDILDVFMTNAALSG